ncbi:MAG: hypothetical protein H0S80_13015 [Desulfovibrionaceae bacterium]|nr:hypothetical protein [Desulfovibrionaceae bacterium]
MPHPRNRLSLLSLGVIVCLLAACFDSKALAADGQALPLSPLKVEIVSQGRTATFRLYDTTAAREFYDQLPLELDLSNFRDAQWMFYPPEKLNVKASEAYHDGKKGELSYYAPWGDVFMLYKDFYAGDEMHRLGVGLSGIDEIAGMSGKAVIRQVGSRVAKGDRAMRITVDANGNTIVFKLNDSRAATNLFSQLPMTVDVENYGGNEKIFYPPKKLDTAETPLVERAQAGTLAYYAPWGDVVMFYGGFGSAPGLYELGHAVQGGDHIRSLTGAIRIEAAPSR